MFLFWLSMMSRTSNNCFVNNSGGICVPAVLPWSSPNQPQRRWNGSRRRRNDSFRAQMIKVPRCIFVEDNVAHAQLQIAPCVIDIHLISMLLRSPMPIRFLDPSEGACMHCLQNLLEFL